MVHYYRISPYLVREGKKWDRAMRGLFWPFITAPNDFSRLSLWG